MSEVFGIVKSSLSASDKMVSAMQKGDAEAFWQAAKEGVSAVTTMMAIFSNSPVWKAANTVFSTATFVTEINNAYNSNDPATLMKSLFGAGAAVGSLASNIPQLLVPGQRLGLWQAIFLS